MQKRIVLFLLFIIIINVTVIVFILTVNFASDEALTGKLPSMPASETENLAANQSENNVLNIIINSKDHILVNDDVTKILDLKQITVDFINNRGLDPTKSDSPDKALISLKSEKGATYEMYLSVHNELKAAYNIMWNEEAMKQYARNYEALTNEERKFVREVYPYKIAEAEQE